MAERCPQPNPDCRHLANGTCHLSTHHPYPQRDYDRQDKIEWTFCNLEENLVRDVPRCIHDELDEVVVFEKPPRSLMIEAILMSANIHIPRSLRKAIQNEF